MRMLELRSDRGVVFRTLLPERRRDRARGLLGTEGPRRDAALLFQRCRSIHTIGMRVPITVAFLDRHLGVLRVDRVPPWRGRSCWRARHVLECGVGADLRVGDRLSLGDAPRYTLAAAPLGRCAAGKLPPSSSGLGHRPFKAAARVRIPLGARTTTAYAGVEESGRPHRPVKAKIAGSKPVTRARSTGPGSSVGRARG